MTQHNQTIILILPWSSLAKEMIEQYKKQSVKLIIFVEQESDENFLRKAYTNIPPNVSLYRIEKPFDALWQSMSNEMVDKLNQPDIIFNFIGNEFLQIEIEGEGEDWQIDPEAKPQVHFAFIETYLRHISGKKAIHWFNVVYGRTKLSDGKQVFCQSRYGIMGFNNLIRLNPNFQNIHIQDICLTFLRYKTSKDKVIHCNHCSKESFGEQQFDLRSPRSIANLIIKQAEKKIQQL